MTAQPSDPVARDPAAAGDTDSADAIAGPRVRSSRRIRAEHIRDYGIVVFAIALFIYFSIASSVFLTSQNLLNLVFQNATIGIAVGVTHGGLLITPSSSVFTFIGQHRVAGIQYPVLIFAVVAIVLQLVLAYTVFGRHLYGVGDNSNAARLSGLKVGRIVVITFVITGAACGLSGLIDSSMTGSGTSDTSGLGGGLALLAIAGVALGGTSIFGGVGSVWRTVLGVLILGMITNGFDLLAVPDYWQNIVRGILIIFAVAISTMIERRT